MSEVFPSDRDRAGWVNEAKALLAKLGVVRVPAVPTAIDADPQKTGESHLGP
jgi:hypothetical protein